MDQHRKRREGQKGFGRKCDNLERHLSDDRAEIELIGSVRLIEVHNMKRLVADITTGIKPGIAGKAGKDLDRM